MLIEEPDQSFYQSTTENTIVCIRCYESYLSYLKMGRGKMKKVSVIALFLALLLTACNEKKEVPAVASKKIEESKVINGITYKPLFFKGYERDREMEEYYFEEIEMYSNYMDNEIGDLLKKSSEVLVSFKPGKGYTESGPSFIDIYADEEEWFYLTAGALYRSNYKEVTGTQGSFAPNYMISEYYAAKYESEQDPENQFYTTLEDVAEAPKKLDILRLWNDQALLQSYTSDWGNYIDSISFIDFLMKTYGKEKTLKLVTENDDESILNIFGKDLETLISDWKTAK